MTAAVLLWHLDRWSERSLLPVCDPRLIIAVHDDLAAKGCAVTYVELNRVALRAWRLRDGL